VAVGKGTLESMGLTQFGDVYRGRRVLLTGHTGFKGSWLALWLTELGAHVTGCSLPPPTLPNHWDLLDLGMPKQPFDVRDAGAILQLIELVAPEIVFHLAAQSLVRRSYRDPLETWSTNVMGTGNVLDACRDTPSVRAAVVVTSDKCYENRGLDRGYRETDVLGGYDPYSASKAATELMVASYRNASFAREHAPLLATARAGNVIGGGDWSEDRLIPDLVRAVSKADTLEIRNPTATRPWQHVLESLSGYLSLGQRLLEGNRECEGAWNFGPGADDNRTVTDVLTRMRVFWPELAWKVTERPQPHEAQLLYLDSGKARDELGWHPIWSLDTALRTTADWYRLYLETGRAESRSQLMRYVADAHANGVTWTSR
jgi:CDP-glucose 4,6-dehydratase